MKSLIIAGILMLMVGCERSSETSGAPESELIEVRHLTAEDYDGFIATPGKLVAVMFHADWCGPCKIQEPVVEEVVAEFEGKVIFGMVDVDDSSGLARSLGVTGIPDLRLYRNGVMIDAMKGAVPKEQVRNHFAIQVSQLGEASDAPPGGVNGEPSIRPMKKDWLPPGMEAK